MFIVSFLSLPWNGRAPVSISYWKFTKAKTIRFWHCSFSRHGRKVNTWSQTNAGSKRAVNNMVLLNHTVRKKRLCNVVCGILVVSLPTSSETKFHLVQALCSAFALCQHGEAAFVCETELLWPSQTVCQWVYCNVFSFSSNKWSKLCNRDINVSGSYLSPFCLAMFKTKWAKSLSSSYSDMFSRVLVLLKVFAHLQNTLRSLSVFLVLFLFQLSVIKLSMSSSLSCPISVCSVCSVKSV